MADPVPDDGKKWMGIPDRIWNLIFLAIATSVVTFLQSEHAATQATKQEEIKTVLTEKAADLKQAVQAVPPAVAVEAAKVVVEQKAEAKEAAQSKAPEQ